MEARARIARHRGINGLYGIILKKKGTISCPVLYVGRRRNGDSLRGGGIERERERERGWGHFVFLLHPNYQRAFTSRLTHLTIVRLYHYVSES